MDELPGGEREPRKQIFVRGRARELEHVGRSGEHRAKSGMMIEGPTTHAPRYFTARARSRANDVEELARRRVRNGR
jgi:hypothetical protein